MHNHQHRKRQSFIAVYYTWLSLANITSLKFGNKSVRWLMSSRAMSTAGRQPLPPAQAPDIGKIPPMYRVRVFPGVWRSQGQCSAWTRVASTIVVIIIISNSSRRCMMSACYQRWFTVVIACCESAVQQNTKTVTLTVADVIDGVLWV